MPERVSARLRALRGSATLAVSQRAREMAADGKEVISFAAGEPDFPTPEYILAAASRAVHDPANHHYTANSGLPDLRDAIAGYTLRYSGIEVDPGRVLVTNGAKQAIFNLMAALLDPGDEVLVPQPYWVTYPASIALAGGIPVPVPTTPEKGFRATADDLEAARSGATKAVVLVSPHNPTGSVNTAEELADIAEWAEAHDIWVISDEIYQRLSYAEEVAASVASVRPELERLVLINGVAKSFAMTGWRVGWMVGPSDIIDAAARHQSHATGNVSNVSQQAALAALTGPQEAVVAMREAFDRRRRLMYSRVTSMDRIVCAEPQGAFYVFPDVTGLLHGRYRTSEELASAILEEAGVATVAGESFGAPGYIRFSYALAEAEIERGLEKIARLFESI